MTNPFEAFNISDDEETFQPTAAEQKVKRTHHEKRLYKQQQEAAKSAPAPQPVVLNESYPERVRDNAKDVRDKRAPPTPYTKKLGEGHFHDRRSGTGRVYICLYSGTGPERRAAAGETWATSRMS